MTGPEEIQKKAARIFPEYLRSILREENFFPRYLRLNLKLPDSLPEIQSQLEPLIAGSTDRNPKGYSIQYIRKKTRQHGEQDVPDKIGFDSESQYLLCTGNKLIAENFKSDIQIILHNFPILKDWCIQFPVKITTYSGKWKEIIHICKWFSVNQEYYQYYIREIPVPVHSKFIESHTGILRELLDIIIPDKINPDASDFENRYYLKSAPVLVRMRSLDPEKHIHPPFREISSGFENWQNFVPDFHTLVITENLMNYVSLPSMKDGIGILGSGKSVEVLKHISWLHSKKIYYWGDMDVQGFMILGGLRKYFPHIQSILMDADCFDIFKELAVQGTPHPIPPSAEGLTESEYSLCMYLYKNNLRLEQEKISHTYVLQYWKNNYI